MSLQKDNLPKQYIIIITKEGSLKRLITPFKALLLVSIDEMKENEIYLITSVYTNNENILQYGVRGQYYFYYYFIIMG